MDNPKVSEAATRLYQDFQKEVSKYYLMTA
jgi:hypothetical protein